MTAAYQTLAAESNRAARPAAVSVGQRVATQRAEAVRRGAPTRESERFGSADALRTEAEQKLVATLNAEALQLFEQAERRFAQLMETLPGEAAVAEEATGPPSGATAEEQIAALIERFRELFQREEMGRIRAELFDGNMPRQDARLLSFIFQSADEINVTRAQTRNLRVRDAAASAEMTLEMRFRQARTRESRRQDLDFRMRFAQGPAGWRFEALGVRR